MCHQLFANYNVQSFVLRNENENKNLSNACKTNYKCTSIEDMPVQVLICYVVSVSCGHLMKQAISDETKQGLAAMAYMDKGMMGRYTVSVGIKAKVTL